MKLLRARLVSRQRKPVGTTADKTGVDGMGKILGLFTEGRQGAGVGRETVRCSAAGRRD
jgi:hypothetical protein